MTTPTLLAEFELDKDGKPIFYPVDGRKHYKIRLFLADTPPDAFSVTYELDPTYKVNRRNVPRTVPKFMERITSYGDYMVNVAVSTKSSPDAPLMVASHLSDALTRRYQSDFSPEIQKVIQDISTK